MDITILNFQFLANSSRVTSLHQTITTETQKTTAKRLYTWQIHHRPYSDT